MRQKIIVIAFVFTGIVHGIFAQQEAQQAVILDLAGIVELKQADSGVWEKAQRGQTVSGNMFISTGFRSTALLSMGNSRLSLRPLTRIRIVELSQKQNTEKVDINLQAGRVRSEINLKQDTKTDFSVHSSFATASVRGTIFEFDTLYLLVLEGTVEFTSLLDEQILIDAVNSSYADDVIPRISFPEAGKNAKLRPNLPIASEIASQVFVNGMSSQPAGQSSSGGSLSELSTTAGF
ncbi:MAG: FecR family protein [Treponema sp.]|nr:FecR family protein [Treponema sp.]